MYILKTKAISKAFSRVPVLKEVRLRVKPGEVHALMRENGAGKSTLMKILTGIYQKYSGSILLNDEVITIKSPKEALMLGISMIHQELNPLYAMTHKIFSG